MTIIPKIKRQKGNPHTIGMLITKNITRNAILKLLVLEIEDNNATSVYRRSNTSLQKTNYLCWPTYGYVSNSNRPRWNQWQQTPMWRHSIGSSFQNCPRQAFSCLAIMNENLTYINPSSHSVVLHYSSNGDIKGKISDRSSSLSIYHYFSPPSRRLGRRILRGAFRWYYRFHISLWLYFAIISVHSASILVLRYE